VTLTESYDQDGNRTKVVDSLGGTISSTYDTDGRLVTRTLTNGSNEHGRVDLGYDNNGNITSITRWQDLAGTQKVATTTGTYDNNGQVTNLTTTNAGNTVLENFSSTYDAAGQLTTELDNGTSTGFSYDADGQLTGNGGQSLSYDKTGNRTNTGYATGTGNQILSDPTWNYQYDNEGNITQKTNRSTGTYWTYAYDNKNELTSAKDYASGGSLQEEVDFKYDVFGNRIEKDVTQSGTTTVERYAQEWTGEGSPPTGVSTDNVSWNVVADLNGSSSLTTRYLSVCEESGDECCRSKWKRVIRTKQRGRENTRGLGERGGQDRLCWLG
jgi:YD repeat-containing protein